MDNELDIYQRDIKVECDNICKFTLYVTVCVELNGWKGFLGMQLYLQHWGIITLQYSKQFVLVLQIVVLNNVSTLTSAKKFLDKLVYLILSARLVGFGVWDYAWTIVQVDLTPHIPKGKEYFIRILGMANALCS